MIYAIRHYVEYGKMGKASVQSMESLDEERETVYAHSLDQAVTWVRSSDLFAKGEPDDYADGRYAYYSPWKPVTHDTILAPEEGHEEVTHRRQSLVLLPATTIYEDVIYPPDSTNYNSRRNK